MWAGGNGAADGDACSYDGYVRMYFSFFFISLIDILSPFHLFISFLRSHIHFFLSFQRALSLFPLELSMNMENDLITVSLVLLFWVLLLGTSRIHIIDMLISSFTSQK